MNDNAIAIRQETAVAMGELTVDQVLAQVEKIQHLMKLGMKEGEHYGVIPGTNKPTLLKAGAEKLCFMFRLDPQYSIVERELPNGHLKITSTCTLYHIPTGARMGSGMGSCSTREAKYAYRKAERECPKCHKPAIIKGQAQYGGGWVCWKKKDGCGAQFKEGDQSIESQQVGRIDNPDIADQENTVLKMGNKRSLIAGVLNVTACSDLFTQDMEDIAVAREELRAESTVVPPEGATEPAGASNAGAGGKRLKMKKDAEQAGAPAETAPTGGPTPPPGDSVVMVDDKVADALLDRCTKTKVIVDAMMKQLGESRKRNGGGPAPATLRDLTSAEAQWLDKVLTARERQQTAA